MEGIPVSKIPTKKSTMLRGSNTLPPMYISIEDYELDPKLNAVIYTIEIGVEKNQLVYTKKIRRRYSALNSIDSQIREKFNSSPYLLPFPPKKIINSKETSFLEDRSSQLQKYFANLVKLPGISGFDKFVEFFELYDLAPYDDI